MGLFEEAIELDPWGEMARGLDAVARSDEPQARHHLDQVEGTFKKGVIHAALGEREAAFDEMTAATPLIWDDALFLRYFTAEPLRALRNDPRLVELLESLDRSWEMDRDLTP